MPGVNGTRLSVWRVDFAVCRRYSRGGALRTLLDDAAREEGDGFDSLIAGALPAVRC